MENVTIDSNKEIFDVQILNVDEEQVKVHVRLATVIVEENSKMA